MVVLIAAVDQHGKSVEVSTNKPKKKKKKKSLESPIEGTSKGRDSL